MSIVKRNEEHNNQPVPETLSDVGWQWTCDITSRMVRTNAVKFFLVIAILWYSLVSCLNTFSNIYIKQNICKVGIFFGQRWEGT